MPAFLPTSRPPVRPRYPSPERAPRRLGLSAMLLGAAALTGCGRSGMLDEAEETHPVAPIEQRQVATDAGQPDASTPDASDFFGGGVAEYPPSDGGQP